jgi:LmbE family N-acetylglucosaminyl deacetylase
MISSPQGIQRLGTILGVWAHPDDETFCAGGLMAAAVRNGQQVICLTATKGEAGSSNLQKWPRSKMGTIRSRELKSALQVLGVKKHHWLDYKDGQCGTADSIRAAEKIAAYITKYQPDTILTFGPDGLTGHTDHASVSAWVDLALKLVKTKPRVFQAVLTVGQYKKYLQAADAKLNLFFNIDQPPLAPKKECDICFCCTDELCERKQQAFAAMPSQYTQMRAAFDQDYLNEAFRIEAFIEGN